MTRTTGLTRRANRASADVEPVLHERVERRPAPATYLLPERTERYVSGVKLLGDRLVAAAALLVLSPVLLVIAVLVRLRLGKPVLFRQERVGRLGEPFQMVKFRTMLPDRRSNHPTAIPVDLPDRRQTHKAAHDPRHTPLGRFLRAWHLDELPQLVHVVRGEMALVGPRPELVSITDGYESWQHRRHAVRPGLTGLWQVSDVAATPEDMHLHTDLDIRYVDTCSMRTDLRILFSTLPSMLRFKGR